MSETASETSGSDAPAGENRIADVRAEAGVDKSAAKTPLKWWQLWKRRAKNPAPAPSMDALQSADRAQDITLKRAYGYATLAVVGVTLLFSAVLLVVWGTDMDQAGQLELMRNWFVYALVNVIGLAAIVMKYLFSSRKDD